MFRFAHPEYFYLLLLIPAIVVLYFFVRYKYKLQLRRFGNLETLKELMPDASWTKTRIKFILITIVISFMAVALAQPQFGSKLREVNKKGVEIMLVVDVSNSMLAEDFLPSRLERTKFAINRLVEKLGDDRVGMVVFAGDAFVQLPITSDFTSAKNFVNYISPDMVSRQGTAIGEALELAQRSFSDQSGERSRVIILVSDGENHESDPISIATQISEQGTKIHSVGIGTPEGVPLKINGKILKDEQGNIVVSKLNEEIMRSIALSTGGSYIRASNQSIGLDEIIKQIRQMESQEFSSIVFEEYNEQFQYILAAVILLLLIEFIILERRNRFIARMRVFNKEGEKKNVTL